ncbi:hypothetical protein QO239_08395 [Cupriavidus taiwanensis]|uniref:hypothetical protein n=1 Tax=Cupriavidus taiwanensis TaxID=164546 RepID=UPI00253F8027|nr:hypothetical protein [Cupriavidus taiwanensis]MDK3022625.1 hypothetical protein [Cupriavidus taiwanensis]
MEPLLTLLALCAIAVCLYLALRSVWHKPPRGDGEMAQWDPSMPVHAKSLKRRSEAFEAARAAQAQQRSARARRAWQRVGQVVLVAALAAVALLIAAAVIKWSWGTLTQ